MQALKRRQTVDAVARSLADSKVRVAKSIYREVDVKASSSSSSSVT